VKNITFLITLILFIPQLCNASENYLQKIQGDWILADVENANKAQYHIGMIKLKASGDKIVMSYPHARLEGTYTPRKNEITFRPKRFKQNWTYNFSWRDQNLLLQEIGKKEIMIFQRGSELVFKINQGTYDERFSSPDKTYALFKKLLLDNDIAHVTECFMPSMAGIYYKNFTEMSKDHEAFRKVKAGLPEKITLSSNTDEYYYYNLISGEGDKKFAFPLNFVKLPSGIFLILFF
jgi:hypothetical protein